MMPQISFKIYNQKKHKTSAEKMIRLYWETKENLNKWKDVPCLWIGSLYIVKRAILSKLTYRFSKIPIRIPTDFHRNWQDYSQIHMGLQGTQNSQNRFEKEQNRGTYTFKFLNLLQSNSNQLVLMQCGTDVRLGTYINRIELRVQK